MEEYIIFINKIYKNYPIYKIWDIGTRPSDTTNGTTNFYIKIYSNNTVVELTAPINNGENISQVTTFKDKL